MSDDLYIKNKITGEFELVTPSKLESASLLLRLPLLHLPTPNNLKTEQGLHTNNLLLHPRGPVDDIPKFLPRVLLLLLLLDLFPLGNNQTP